MITLRQMQFALAVAKHHHFKKAAQECDVSQSALSLGIAEMEKNLGVTIFERNNKQVITTPIGHKLLERARSIYLDAQQLVECAHTDTKNLNFAMSIGFIPTIAPYLLPMVLPEIIASYPNFKLNIVEDISERILNCVRVGSLDAAVIALPYPIEGLNSFEFAQENFYVVCHKNNPLSREESINPAMLKKADLLLLGEGHCLKDQIVEICCFGDKLSKNSYKEASLNTLLQMAINDMGTTLVPEMALPSLKNIPNISLIPLNISAPHRRLSLVTRPNYSRTNELLILIKMFTKALASKK